MNSVCITGYLSTDLRLVEEILNQAGMQAALSAQRDSSMSISVWHQQVAALLAKDNNDANGELDSPVNLGRLWEQLASDIFISNLNTQTWGWADTRSGSLLPFWKSFDPQLRFVLVVCSPERMIAYAIENSESNPNIEKMIDQWQSYTEALLTFYKKNPNRSIVVNVQDCVNQPASFIQTLNKKWCLQLNKVHFPNVPKVGFSDLARYLAAGLVQTSARYKGLSDKFLESVTSNSSGSRSDAIPSLDELIQWYRKLQGEFFQKEQDQRAFQNKQNKLTERLDEERATSAELSAQNVVLERKQKELTIEIDSLRSDFMRLKRSNNNLQEELKKLQDFKAQFDKAIEGHEQQKEQHTGVRNQLDAHRHTLEQYSEVKDIKEENKLLLLQLQQVQVELESYFLKYQEATNEVLRAQNDQVTNVRDLTVKLNTANALVNTYASEVKDLHKESELLLLQLQQVQKELETYSLKHQEATRELESVQARWRRMLVRNPEYCGFESIEIESVAQDKAQRAIWKIKGMDVGGRHIPEILFVTFIEKGIAGFEFSRESSGAAGLIRWPVTLAEDITLTIAMSGDAKHSEKRALAIIGLSTSDWFLIGVLISLLRKSLSSPSSLKTPEYFDSTALIKALDQLDINLKQIPDVLRYDKVKLKREQLNPDYEHLWFSFENMKASGQLIGDFEYRISCTNVRPKKFGNYPKLEFPEETCKTVIQSWFDESYDDYGAKLELRFALPDSMDIEVWSKLTTHDQKFVRELIKQLPYVLEDLRLNGNSVKRGWDEWKLLVSETHRVLNMRTEPSKPTPVTRKARKRPV